MRAQIGGKTGFVVADLGDYGNAIDVSINGVSNWASIRLTLRSARKLAVALAKMAEPALPPKPKRKP